MLRCPWLEQPVQRGHHPGVSGDFVPRAHRLRLLDAEFWLLSAGLLNPNGFGHGMTMIGEYGVKGYDSARGQVPFGRGA